MIVETLESLSIQTQDNNPGCSLISGAPQREVYFMGLIDVLTQYDTKKKAAHAAKTVKHGVSGSR